jgi:hypothetical protein
VFAPPGRSGFLTPLPHPLCLQKLGKVGLFLKGEFQDDDKLLVLKIGASVERLKKHADAIDFKMLLDPQVIPLRLAL